MSSRLLDTTYLVETPEGIDLHAELAGPIPRILAYAIDISIRLIALMAASTALSSLGKAGTGVILVLSFLAEWFYPVFFEVLKKGQTPGKRVLGLAVVNDDLTPISWGTSMVRNLLRAADFLPSFYLGGLISMTINKHFQRLGDIAAGTLVIHRRPHSAGRDNPHSAGLTAAPLPDDAPVMPPFPMALEDQQALVNFIQRHNSLSPDRQKELADILLRDLPAAAGNTARTDSVSLVRGWGAWLLGGR